MAFSHYVRTPEFRAKISEQRKGINNPMFGKTAWNKGLTIEDPRVADNIKKMSQTNKGKIPWNKGKKGVQKGWNTGLKMPPLSFESRKKMSESHRGEKSHLWKGGKDPLNRLIRQSFKYRQWRSDIFTRDNFICQYCEARSGNGKAVYLEAHHLKEFYKIIDENKITDLEQAFACEELWNINNGITLCEDCHNKTKPGRV